MLYIVKGRARFRWGEHLEFSEEAGPGDFIFVPPYVPHQEMNARPDEPVEAVVVRSGQDPVVINLDIAEANDSPVPFHPRAGGNPERSGIESLEYTPDLQLCFRKRKRTRLKSRVPENQPGGATTSTPILRAFWRRARSAVMSVAPVRLASAR